MNTLLNKTLLVLSLSAVLACSGASAATAKLTVDGL
ncbi:MAG: hypothetical protein RLZZ502_1031, partial [Pseudomonadota bacterium]